MSVSVRPPFVRVRAEDVGWVLANAREHAADPRLRTAAGFARGGPYAEVHRSQVGRWESGHTPASFEVVRRYEETLGLERGHLGILIDVMARRVEPLRAEPAVARPQSPNWAADTIALVEKAVSEERLTGVEWDDLSGLLAGHPDALLRGADWERLLSRVTLEVATTLNLEYAFRAEAAARLAGHPRSGPHVTELARRALADPSTQIFEAVGLVQYSTDPLSAEVLVDALAAPDPRESVIWSTLFGLTSLATAGRLEGRQRSRAGTVALDLLRDVDRPLRVHRSAAAFLAAIDPPTRSQIVSALRASSRQRIAQIVDGGSAFAESEITAMSKHIEHGLSQLLGPRARWAPQLQDLVTTATSAAHVESRGMALEVLMLSPQAPAVAGAYAAELRELIGERHMVLADDALARLAWMLQPEDVAFTLELALDRSIDPVTAQQAAIAIGNARLPDDVVVQGRLAGEPALTAQLVAERFLASSIEHIRRDDDASGHAARGHLYALGMAGRFDLLQQLDLVARERDATAWTTALRWWLELPEWARPAPPEDLAAAE